MKFAENSKKEEHEADVAFKKLGDLVKKSDIDRHWIYLQAVDRYKELCKKTINLRMLSIISQDWTSAEGNEAREKLKSDCDSLKNLTWKEHIETRRKLDVACQLLEEFQNKDSVENRRKLTAACEAITEGCLAVVKAGFFIPKEYQIAD
jgi:predicted deacetylase